MLASFMSRAHDTARLCSLVWRHLVVTATVLATVVAAAQAQPTSIRISEILIDPPGANDGQAIELFNTGPTPVSLNGAVIAVGDETRALTGLADVPPGGTVVIRWNQTGTSSGSQLFTGETFELDPAEGNLALFKSDQVTEASELVAYVQWGAADQARADLAARATLWDPAAFLPPAAEGQSMALLPGAVGRTPAEWFSATAPSIGSPNSAPVRGFRGWAPVGGHSIHLPSVVFVPDGETLELVSVAPDGTIQHHRFLNDAWRRAATLGAALVQPPALTASTGGTLELVAVGADRQVLHNRFLGGQWGSFVPTGGQSAHPVALTFNATANSAELLIVGTDGQLLHSRFNNGQWSPFARVGGQSSAPAALASSSQGGLLDLLFSGVDRTVFHARLTGSAWSAPVPTAGETAVRPALASLPDGSLDAAITGTDGSVLQNRFQNGAWRGWQPIPGVQSDLPPTLVFSPESGTTELFIVGRDRLVRHVRRIGEAWGAPVLVGAVAAFSVAAVASKGGLVELVITGHDSLLWHNRFQVNTEPETSFAKDIQPIFTANCSCHLSSAAPHGLQLSKGEAYANLVDVPSAESDLDRIEPSDPSKSYLWHKINGTQKSVGGSGGRMPLGRAPLSPERIEKIRQWIEQGAKEN